MMVIWASRAEMLLPRWLTWALSALTAPARLETVLLLLVDLLLELPDARSVGARGPRAERGRPGSQDEHPEQGHEGALV